MHLFLIMWFFLINDLKCTLCSFSFNNTCIIYYILVFLNIELTQGSQNTFEPQGSIRVVWRPLLWACYADRRSADQGLTPVLPGPRFLVKAPAVGLVFVIYLFLTKDQQEWHSEQNDVCHSAMFSESCNPSSDLLASRHPLSTSGPFNLSAFRSIRAFSVLLTPLIKGLCQCELLIPGM